MADDPIIQVKTQLAGMSGVDDLKAIEALTGTGIAARTGTNTWALRTLTAPAAGITVSNGNGVSGNPTLALADDLSAVEGLASTGIAARTASNTWTTRTLTAGSGVSITNGDGVSGNPTISATGSGGTVTSVGLSLPSIITVSGSPVTTSGTLTGTLATQTANTVFSGPTTGVAATPTFRALVSADVPNLDAGKITTGTLGVARGGTGATSTPSNGQIPIGNGSTYTAATITAGSGISVTNGSGSITIASSGTLLNNICYGRLTLTSSTPVTTGDVTGATTVYFTPCSGNRIALKTGGTWTVYEFTQFSWSSTISSLPMDFFVEWNGSALQLLATNWTNDTTRATALAYEDGVLVLSGSVGRRYVGTARGVSSAFEDSRQSRNLWNYYNRVDRDMYVEDTSAAYAYASAAWREFRNVATQRLQYVVGVLEDSPSFDLWAGLRGTGINRVAFGFNSTSSPSNPSTGFIGDGGGSTRLQYVSNGTTARRGTDVVAGYNYVTCLQYTDTGSGDYEKMRLSGTFRG